jgi:uncharacterized membrane protein YccC
MKEETKTMPHWRISTAPARDGDELTGNFTDSDLQFRLHAFGDMLVKAEAAVAEAQRQLDEAIQSGRRNGQDAIVEEALRRLAERRGRG